MGLTYDQLAKISGVSRRTLVSIETGSSPGSMETWFRLSAALEVGLDEMFSVVTTGVPPATPDLIIPAAALSIQEVPQGSGYPN